MLSICIPTYNRRERIEKNLKEISSYIRNNKLYKKVQIVVSNNNSKDDTKYFLEKFLEQNKDIDLKIYNQLKDLEIQKNQIFVVEKADKEYFMWLSDDDYISEEYLLKVLEIIKRSSGKIISIIPSYQHISKDNELLNKGRDFNKLDKKYEKGFKTALLHSWKAHQMSGLVFSRNILTIFNERRVNNLYPFIFFSTYSQLKGEFYYLTESPVKITAGVKKYWNYGKDGLINGIMENFKKIYEISYLERVILEIHFLLIQKWRYLQYRFKIYKLYKELLLCENMTIITKVLLGPIIIIMVIYSILKKFFRV